MTSANSDTPNSKADCSDRRGRNTSQRRQEAEAVIAETRLLLEAKAFELKCIKAAACRSARVRRQGLGLGMTHLGAAWPAQRQRHSFMGWLHAFKRSSAYYQLARGGNGTRGWHSIQGHEHVNRT